MSNNAINTTLGIGLFSVESFDDGNQKKKTPLWDHLDFNEFRDQRKETKTKRTH